MLFRHAINNFYWFSELCLLIIYKYQASFATIFGVNYIDQTREILQDIYRNIPLYTWKYLSKYIKIYRVFQEE